MNSHDIRAKISQAVQQEEETGTATEHFSAHMKKMNVSLTQDEISSCLFFIRSYVEETPDIMDAAYHAASSVNAQSQIQPVLDVAFGYWLEGNDLIPDHLGLFGLLDDAYLTRLFMETVSILHRQRCGTPLLSIDLGPTNRSMRAMIGDPVVSQLDTIVAQNIASSIIQAQMSQLAGFGAGFHLAGFGREPTMIDIERSVDAQLGAMGVF